MRGRVFLGIVALAALCVLAAAADHYQALELQRTATSADIKRAYRNLSLKYHPDKNKGNKEAEEKFLAVSAAYAVLGDDDKKVIYDTYGESKMYSRDQFAASGVTSETKDFYQNFDLVKTLNSKMLRSVKKPLLAEFYANWCVHCQEMVSEYRKAALLLEDVATVAAVNCEREKNFCQQQGIQSYPTLRLYMPPIDAGGPTDMEQYMGAHTAEAIYSFVEQAAAAKVIPLNTANFNANVMKHDELWIVDFSASEWCGPCTNAKPSLRRLAGQLAPFGVKVGIVNCDVEKELCPRLNVPHYPLFRIFGKVEEGMPKGDGKDLAFNQNQFILSATLDLIGNTLAGALPRLPPPPPPPSEEPVATEPVSELPVHQEL